MSFIITSKSRAVASVNVSSAQSHGLVLAGGYFGGQLRTFSPFARIPGTHTGAPVPSPIGGGFGVGLQMDNTQTVEFSDIDNLVDNSGDFTISSWVSDIKAHTDWDAYGAIGPHISEAADGNVTSLQRDVATNALLLYGSGPGGSSCNTSISDIADGQPHLLTIVRSGDDHMLYVDGVFDVTRTVSAQTTTGWRLRLNDARLVGYRGAGTYSFFTFHNFAMSAAQAYALWSPSTRFNLHSKSSRTYFMPAAAAGGLSIPIAAYHYNHNMRT